jgi:Ca2+-binding RTX toxin-like protein
VLRFDTAVTINDISVATISTYNAKITISAGVDEITVNNLLHSSSYHIETILFSDGFQTSLPDYAAWTTGTSGADSLTGTSGDNTIIGKDGNDTLDGAGGNDDIHGGSGNDTLYGGSGADLLHGGVGDDTLYGQDGLDTLFGGAGADTFVFETASAFNNLDVIKDFSTAQNDVLDLSDLLGGYDPLTDAITDFVWITESAGNSNVFVDRDGLGGTYSLVAIATLSGVTGLTDEAALLSNGTIIA